MDRRGGSRQSSANSSPSFSQRSRVGSDAENRRHFSSTPPRSKRVSGRNSTRRGFESFDRSMDTQTTIEFRPQKASVEENVQFDDKFQAFFDKVAGADGEIDSFELQAVVNAAFKNELGGKQFSLEACRSMVAMTDRDRNGRMDYGEFRNCWRHVMEWKGSFKEYDKDNSGDMNAVELRGALAKLGFKLSTPALSSIALRYANKVGNVSLDDFVQICCRVKSTFESYLAYQGKSFSLDDFIMSAIYT